MSKLYQAERGQKSALAVSLQRKWRTHVGALDRYARNPYALWDASLARPNGRVRPFLQLTNITDTIYQEVLGVPMPRRGVIGGMEIVMPLAR